jgi:AcrR family transcriptional regulator
MLAPTPNDARPRGAARREALLDAVLRVVAEAGADAVTHRRVADVAGLPLASTTYWFQSKEHLLTAAFERAADRDIERLRADLGDAPERTPDPVGLAVDAILGPNDLAKAPPSGAAAHLPEAPPSGAAANNPEAPPSGAAANNPNPAARGWLLATYALMLEAARRPALREVTERWTDAYLEMLPPLLAAAGSQHPRADAALLLAAADGLLIDQLASGHASAEAPPLGAADHLDLGPQLRRLADALVKA